MLHMFSVDIWLVTYAAWTYPNIFTNMDAILFFPNLIKGACSDPREAD